MDIVWYCGIMEELSRFSIRGESERSLAELLQQMLAWKPENRISAAEALLHPCMQFAIGSQRTEAEAVRDNQPSPSTGEKRQRTASPPEPHKRDPSRPELPQAEPDLRRRE
ncbi:MAG: hypothetical protein FRX48_06360 [Lasallia pustulata]|uniref:Protein kinase domain-containing protein n=1 Tax=Lasallia pustulata TaxID=136370 RepID=A0A5M8PLJ2_9LECA|nr:MAG: hypothetical protein FRX48_06360 [Lasallia pustulata]